MPSRVIRNKIALKETACYLKRERIVTTNLARRMLLYAHASDIFQNNFVVMIGLYMINKQIYKIFYQNTRRKNSKNCRYNLLYLQTRTHIHTYINEQQ